MSVSGGPLHVPCVPLGSYMTRRFDQLGRNTALVGATDGGLEGRKVKSNSILGEEVLVCISTISVSIRLGLWSSLEAACRCLSGQIDIRHGIWNMITYLLYVHW